MKEKILQYMEALRERAKSLEEGADHESLAGGVADIRCAHALRKVAADLERIMSKSTEITPGLYRRMDGEKFRVVGIARHTEADYNLIVYHPEASPSEWMASPMGVFTEHVPANGSSSQRFVRIEEEKCKENGSSSTKAKDQKQ